MDFLSIGAISAWQQQQVAQQVGIAMLKKSLDMQARGRWPWCRWRQGLHPPLARFVVASPDAAVGQNLDVVA